MPSKVIIITGASKGIGKAATLEAITKFDAKVVAIARSEALLEQLKQQVEADYGDYLISTSFPSSHLFKLPCPIFANPRDPLLSSPLVLPLRDTKDGVLMARK